MSEEATGHLFALKKASLSLILCKVAYEGQGMEGLMTGGPDFDSDNNSAAFSGRRQLS